MARVRSYPVNLVPDLELPRGLFDPRWAEPRIAAKVALEVYKRALFSHAPFDAGPLLPARDLPRFPRSKTQSRSFALEAPLGVGAGPGPRFRGGAINELHHRYTFGGGQPPVNFHAQVITFGVDESGRYMLRATLGRYDGRWGNDAALTLALEADGTALGGVVCAREMDPAGDQEISVLGADPALARAFFELDRITVSFYAEHRGDRGPAKPREETEDDRVLDHALDLFGAGSED